MILICKPLPRWKEWSMTVLSLLYPCKVQLQWLVITGRHAFRLVVILRLWFSVFTLLSCVSVTKQCPNLSSFFWLKNADAALRFHWEKFLNIMKLIMDKVFTFVNCSNFYFSLVSFSFLFLEWKHPLASYTSTFGEMFIANVLHLSLSYIDITGTDFYWVSSNSNRVYRNSPADSWGIFKKLWDLS